MRRLRLIKNKITLTNRQAGPDALLQVVEDRCDGQFIEIENVITKKELKQHADKYKMVAGINIKANPTVTVFVEGDRSLPYEIIINLMNILQLAGANNVNLITEPST